ncbi:hypothetical protein D3C85_1158930 [compost metagenome]
MEGGVEDDSLRHIRHVGIHRRDAQHVRRVVQRRQIEETPDLLLHLVRDEDGALERLAAVYDTMADGVDLRDGRQHAMLGMNKYIQHPADGRCMLQYFIYLVKFGFIRCLMNKQRSVHPDALYSALGEHRTIFHIVQLILQRGAARINDKNVHRRSPSLSYLKKPSPVLAPRCPARTICFSKYEGRYLISPYSRNIPSNAASTASRPKRSHISSGPCLNS